MRPHPVANTHEPTTKKYLPPPPPPSPLPGRLDFER